MSDTRDVVLQAVLDKLWSSHIEHTDAPGARNEYGNPSAVELNRGRRVAEETMRPEHCPYCGELRDQIPCQACGGPR